MLSMLNVCHNHGKHFASFSLCFSFVFYVFEKVLKI